MLIVWNSKRLHAYKRYFSYSAAVWRHNPGRSLHVLKAEVWWRSSGIMLRMVWEAGGDPWHSEEATCVFSDTRRGIAGVAATTTLKAAPQNTVSFLWAWEKVVPAALGTPSPGMLVEHTCQFLLRPLLITSRVTVHLPLSFAGWMKIIPGFDYFSFDWA